MRCFCVAIAFSLGVLASLNAAEQKFPYQATVIAEKVEVRCGPGLNFYVTSLLKPNDVVTVHRHDHGGWFMIAPPKGSISWIDASLVKRTNGDRGTVQVAPQDGRPARAIVRIGSTVSDDHSYYGRELSNGDEVTILGEQTLNTARGPVKMFKIVPPAQEFRWLKGEFLVPLDDRVRQQIAQDPYQIPAEHRPAFLTQKQQQENIAQQQRQQVSAARKSLYDRLDAIDQKYAAMMQLEPAKWKLDQLEAEYRQLEREDDAAIRALVQKRIDVLDRRREILSHYQNFVRVSAESARRDQELVTLQLGLQREIPGGEIAFPGTNDPRGRSVPEEDASVAPRLNGAGIVQVVNNIPGSPQYGLIAPDGRLLALLEAAEGISLRQWIGKPAGIIGNRQFEPQYGAELIRVQRIVPIQLVP